jgi:pullulanase
LVLLYIILYVITTLSESSQPYDNIFENFRKEAFLFYVNMLQYSYYNNWEVFNAKTIQSYRHGNCNAGFYILGSFDRTNIVKAAEELKINIHYHRYANDYEGWNIWSWIGSGEGASYEFNGEDDFGQIATYTLEVEDGTTQIGFIVRHSTDSNAWDKKDTNSDRFMDVTKANDGVLDIYVVQDDPNFGYGEDEMSLAPKIMKAALSNSTTIDFSVTTAFDSTASDITSKISVKDAEGKTYQINSVKSKEGTKATSATITLTEELSVLNKYTLIVEGYGEFPISSSALFSTKEFEDAFYYEGNDLGAVWSKAKTTFRVWAPTATEVLLNLYTAGVGTNLMESIPMMKNVKGTWFTEKAGDLNKTYYTYTVTVDGVAKEAVDPYAKAVGVNGDRGMVIDLSSTNPDGFTQEVKPVLVNPTDSIIYELHIRDFSVDKSSGIVNKGKYLAFTENGTKSPTGAKTGIDYLVDLGITHVHLLPSFDYASVDETRLLNNQFNWGYDPENYNVPEGSYSTDPHHGEIRVNEYKQMVQALHNKGIRVVMDVVYNHTSVSADSNFNKIVPGYYYRMTEDGQFSNASGCGNETASERLMVRKFIVDSVVYWAKEYHVDGFRFDLMGIHDIETMNAIRKALNEVDPTILVYGEGWTGGSSTLPDNERALKANMTSVDDGIAAFSDDIRDGIKGSVFQATEQGFVTGKTGIEESIKFGVVASTKHSQVDYSKVNYSKAPWAAEPTQTITYASAHDNLTLWDKIASSNPTDTLEDRIKMNLLSSAIVLTSQGTPFFQAGEEFLRSKPVDATGTTFDENSYQSPDSVNSLKWDLVSTNAETWNYYKGLIAFRKAHSSLRMTKTSDIQANLTFVDGLDANVIGYTINNSPNGEDAKSLCIIYNANKTASTVTIPEGDWNVYVKGKKAGTEILETISGGKVTVDPISTLILVKEDGKSAATNNMSASNNVEDSTVQTTAIAQNNNSLLITILGILGAVVVIAGVIVFVTKHRKK